MHNLFILLLKMFFADIFLNSGGYLASCLPSKDLRENYFQF